MIMASSSALVVLVAVCLVCTCSGLCPLNTDGECVHIKVCHKLLV